VFFDVKLQMRWAKSMPVAVANESSHHAR